MEGDRLEFLQPIERLAQPVDGVDAAMDMRAVRRRSRRFDLDPHQALLAEAHDPRRTDIAADIGVAPRVRDVLQQVAGAERAHILLVAREREHDLARPGVAMLGQQCRGEQRAGQAALHVADAAAVELAVLEHAAQRRHGPGEVFADREGVEMAVEDQPPAGPLAFDAADQAHHPRRRLDALDLDAGDLAQQRFGDRGDVVRVARRVGRGHRHQPLGVGDQALAGGVDAAGELVAQGEGGRHQRFCSRRSHQRIAMASGQQITK